MTNLEYKPEHIVRTDGTRILSFAFLDRDIDVLEIFEPRILALRRDIGDMRFIESVDQQGLPYGRLFLVTEYPTEAHSRSSHVISVIAFSLNESDFGRRYEVMLDDPGFRLVDWGSGMRKLRSKASVRDLISRSQIFSKLCQIDGFVSSTLPKEELRSSIGPETGARFEVSLS